MVSWCIFLEPVFKDAVNKILASPVKPQLKCTGFYTGLIEGKFAEKHPVEVASLLDYLLKAADDLSGSFDEVKELVNIFELSNKIS